MAIGGPQRHSERTVTSLPIQSALPALLQGDQFLTGLSAGLDEVLAPVIEVLDCLTAYLDVDLAPADFVDWLGSWVGVERPLGQDHRQHRRSVARASAVHRARGTAAAIADAIALDTGADATVIETGQVIVSQHPVTVSGSAEGPAIVVRVRLRPGAPPDLRRIDAAIERNKPAHVVHRVEVVPS